MQNLCICSDQKSKLVTTAEIRGHRMPKRIVAVFYVFSILSRHHLDVKHINHSVDSLRSRRQNTNPTCDVRHEVSHSDNFVHTLLSFPFLHALVEFVFLTLSKYMSSCFWFHVVVYDMNIT